MMDSYDFVVVGAGTAGCVIASRLSERTEAQVLLLEAGSALTVDEVGKPQAWSKLRGTPANWGESTVVQAASGTSIPLARGRGWGGSSSINAMLFARGHRSSYDAWVAQDAKGWGFDDLLPYLRRSEQTVGRDPALRGTDGPLVVGPGAALNPFVEDCWNAATELGHRRATDISGGSEDGFGRVDQNIVDGRRQSAADAYLAPAASRPNLRVVSGATVTRLRLNGEKCVGLDYWSESGELVSVVCGEEVVIAAGTVGSATLLMRSGIGPEDHLRDMGLSVAWSLPGVGSNLHDHPTCAVVYLPMRSVSPKTDNHLERVLGLAHSQLSTGAPDLQILFQDNPVAGPNQTAPPHGYAIRASLMLPHSRGTVRLSRADPSAAPVLDPQYYSDARDLRIMRDGLDMAREIGRAKALEPWREAEYLPGPDLKDDAQLHSYLLASLGSYSHPVGTCRMGTDRHAVVDTQLRVHGIDRLRVADGSIIPSLPSANTNATIYGIAERAVELIAGDSW
jgi:choline dehydrogenase-like flavoprotein